MSETLTINLIETLKEKFPCETIDVYGECLVVPSKQFEQDWDGFSRH